MVAGGEVVGEPGGEEEEVGQRPRAIPTEPQGSVG